MVHLHHINPVTMVTWERKSHTVKIIKETECIQISMKETKNLGSEAHRSIQVQPLYEATTAGRGRGSAERGWEADGEKRSLQLQGNN